MTVILEINTLVWLGELSERYARRVTLGDVPEEVWDGIALPGVDAVWLMGVWRRSPAGRRIALDDSSLRAAFRAVFPGPPGTDDGLRDTDVTGSPYCVRDYVVDATLGGPDGLAAARARLAARGLRLVLDHVPHHIAPDHPWTATHPERLVRGTAADLARAPDAYVETGSGHVYARARDPYFPPWPDVVQLNAFHTTLRDATVDTLVAIGDQADGVRCDMAMLLMNDIFTGTWGEAAGPVPAEDFWTYVIPRVRARHPRLLFIAEAYWGREQPLLRQGFDLCYDKGLYDRLVRPDASASGSAAGAADAVRHHLRGGPDDLPGLVRFLENHDEPRAAAVLPGERGRAAAVTVATLPGATLWHEGQFEGRRTHLPVFLTRRPREPVDVPLRDFHTRLLRAAATVRRGEWRPVTAEGWPDNDSYRSLLAWTWTAEEARHLVVVNYSDRPAQARLPLPWPGLRGRSVRLTDLLTERTYDRDGDELAEQGLYVDLEPWHVHVFGVDRPGAGTEHQGAGRGAG
ncbi:MULTISPECIES: alpha-amylase [unclassified Streptomyces]|uniref:alpha-amylase n=1 Tax=unclassified Streptomyces TaxID=2593676 RepID=UPI003805C134